MPERLTKLRPDRDLQCYFQQPSAIAALSETSASGFTLSGCWRQAFDWAVVEWCRDNVFEHPALRNLPDGDLSGMRLGYEETRTNCIALDSTTYDAVGWSYLRVWEESDGVETFHWVPLARYATAIEGDYIAATAEFELQGVLTAGDYIELAWLDQHYNYVIQPGDTAEMAVTALAVAINADTETNGAEASATGGTITLTYRGAPGANGNRIGVYGTVHGTATEGWSPEWTMFTGGRSPLRWRVDIDFSDLIDEDGQQVNTTNVRKLRWTWAAEFQFKDFEPSEFAVVVSNWQVTGSGLEYVIAGPGSRRIEDDRGDVIYTGLWEPVEHGNYSGASIRKTTQPGSSVQCTYSTPFAHTLYLGTRYVDQGGAVTIQLDANTIKQVNLKRSTEDVLIRVPVIELSGGTPHTVIVTHSGESGTEVYFDFLEIAVPTADLPTFATDGITTLATDWDTNHSIAIAPERTAWLIRTLGFTGRANHYAGAMWFYELSWPGNRYATGTVEFAGTPRFGDVTEITIAGSPIRHANLIGDTAESIAKCFELLIRAGSSAVWAEASGTTLRISARAMGAEGNDIELSATTNNPQFTATASSTYLAGGVDVHPVTDLNAMPRLNRAVRDWSRSFFRGLKQYDIDVAAAFSMELKDGDTSEEAAIAQRYLNQPCVLKTPAVQTNFGPESMAFWKQVYLEMAAVMDEAGVTPYLQFGEVQWWYFADQSSLPFYDAFTKAAFETHYGRPLAVIPSETADPAQFPEECEFLPTLIGQFTEAVIEYVREAYPRARFEVLYPPDVNDTPLNKLVNFPSDYWTPSTLDCLKTENFTYTGDRNLNKARESIQLPRNLKFPPSKSSHLVGIGDYATPWEKERRLSVETGVESVVLFALDQFCLIGYGVPLRPGSRRARRMGP
jgi:hypothetical protein